MEDITGLTELENEVRSEVERYSINSETTTCCATGTCS